MSGILTVFHADGRPVDRSLLDRLTESMAYRGPDAQESRVLGNVGFGHTMLRTTFEAQHEKQPASLDGEVWICADARVDDRAELRRKLAAQGRVDLRRASDSELILHSYSVWGIDCLEHLLGDFAFVIWDRPRRRLFCARDPFGVKPLFYAHVGESLVISNTLETVRLHPEVSDTLDELAIADELLFDYFQDSAATDFTDIRRLPAGHRLVSREGSLSVSPYWTLPVEPTIRYRHDSEYIEHFREVFDAAVGDRLRFGRIAIGMSGGLDSTAVAASGCGVLEKSQDPIGLKAFTIVYDHVIPDEERQWAGLAAGYLKIPIHFTVSENHAPFKVSATGSPDTTVFEAHSQAIIDYSPVKLTGFGGDPLNRGSSSCYLDLIKKGQLGCLLTDLRKVLQEGKRPPLHIRTLWRRRRSKRQHLGSYPDWINKDFEAAFDLRTRWHDVHSEVPIGWSGYEDIVSPHWADMFEASDPGHTRFPIENRHPFFDLRVVRYMLRVPPLPWYLQKVLLRKAMRDRLPHALLTRPKTVLAANPDDVVLRQKDRDWWSEEVAAAPSIKKFIDEKSFLKAVERHLSKAVADPDRLHRAIGLARWLRREEARRQGSKPNEAARPM